MFFRIVEESIKHSQLPGAKPASGPEFKRSNEGEYKRDEL
jgi:hypothetical protein